MQTSPKIREKGEEREKIYLSLSNARVCGKISTMKIICVFSFAFRSSWIQTVPVLQVVLTFWEIRGDVGKDINFISARRRIETIYECFSFLLLISFLDFLHHFSHLKTVTTFHICIPSVALNSRWGEII